MYDFLLVINSNLPPILHRFPDIAVDRSEIAILGYTQWMSADGQGTQRRRNIAENFNRLSRAHERSDRQTDGRATANKFTFAKKPQQYDWIVLSTELLIHISRGIAAGFAEVVEKKEMTAFFETHYRPMSRLLHSVRTADSFTKYAYAYCLPHTDRLYSKLQLAAA